jgi:hypothetical protein
MILDARKNVSTSIRELNPLKNPINFQAKSIEQLLFWKKADVYEHPLTMDISTTLLKKYHRMKKPPFLHYDFPAHSQATERHVRLLTETGNKVSDDEREGLILSILRSRKINPTFNTKKDYNI